MDLGSALQLTEMRASRADTLLGQSVGLLRQQTSSGFRERARRLLYLAAFISGAVAALKLEKS